MQLKSLYLKNIKNHEDLKVDFTSGITAIIGKNGKGKTTILESIGFVLFDYLPYKQKEFITHGKTWGQIELTIRMDKPIGLVTVNRRIGNNPHYKVTHGYMDIIGKEDVQEFIKDNLNIDMDLQKLYSEIIAIPQGLATAHFMLPKTQRGQIFDSILGVDIYRNCWSKLQPVQKLVDNELDNLKNDINMLEHDTKDYKDRKDNLEDLDAEIKDLKEKISVTELAYNNMLDEKSELDRLEELSSSVEWLKNMVEYTKNDLKKAEKGLESINPSKYNKDELKKKIDKLDSDYNAYQCSILALQESEHKIENYNTNIGNCNKEIKRLQNITLNNLCPVINERCDRISTEKIKEINDEINNINDSLNEYNKLIGEENKKHFILSKGIKEIKNNLIEYNDLKELYYEIQANEKRKQQLIEEIKKINIDLKKYNEELTQLLGEAKEYDEDRLRFLETDVIDVRDTLSRLEERVSQIELQRASEHSDILEIEGMLERLKEYRKKYKENKATLEKIKRIRDIFRDVGSKLVDNYLNNISYDANQIYQELMDTTETLEWDNSYELKVGDKKFQQLSGGQQMIASIAIRLSLVKYFSNMNLIILDEPTANLDETRREALAESIRKLEGYNQILVVTHDDSFSTITDNIVNLQNI